MAAACDVTVKIPMRGRADSLNLAVATGIMIYAATQRRMTRILALHAHPDDCETLAVGTLARLAALGCAITIATATAGECGAVEASPEETARHPRARGRPRAAA